MATTDAIVNVKVLGLASLTQLDSAFAKLQKKVGGLSGAIAGLGLAAFTRNAFQAADAMVDLSNATGVTIGQIIELQYAIVQAGGRLDQINSSVVKFGLGIDEARNGSTKLQAAFSQLGISLDDLARMSEDQLLREVAKGFVEITDKSKAAALANDIFGKSIRGVDIQEYARQILDGSGKYDEYAQSVEKAARIQDKLDKALIDLRISFLNIIEPLVTFVDNLKASEGGIERFTTLIKALTIAISVLAGGILFRGIATLIGSLGRAYTGFKRLSAARSAAGDVKKLGGSMDDAAKAGKKAADAIEDKWRAAGPLMNALRGAAVVLGGLVGLGTSASLAMSGGGGSFRGGKGASGSWGEDAAAGEVQQNIEVEDGLKSIRTSVKDITQAYAQQNDERIKSLNLERLYLGMTENEVEVQKAVGDVIDENQKAIQDLVNKKAALSKDEKQLGAAALIDEEIRKLNERLEADKAATAEAVRGLQERRAETEKLLHINNMVRDSIAHGETLTQLQEELALVGLYGEELEKQQELLQSERELRQSLQTIALDILDLKAKEATMNADEFQQELARHQERIKMAYELRDAQVNAATESRDKRKEVEQSYTEGIKRGLEDISKEMTPLKIAQKAVDNGFQKMSDTLDEFVETGKLNFADLARSIILDITKMIAKMLIFKAIEAGLNALFPGLGSTVMAGARANGGPVGKNKPYLVGEKGPELFVPNSAGNVVPNNELGGQVVSQPVTNNNVVYNISAIDSKSVAQFFYENRKAMLGTVTMARKEMPYATA